MKYIKSEAQRERDRECQRRYALRIKNVLRRYKTLKGCADCGYRAHHAALEFDHITPEGGQGVRVSRGCNSLPKLKKELEKCEVVCRNCHGIRTWKRQQ